MRNYCSVFTTGQLDKVMKQTVNDYLFHGTTRQIFMEPDACLNLTLQELKKGYFKGTEDQKQLTPFQTVELEI